MDRKKAIALSFSVPVAWGFSYPLMKIGMDGMNATSIVALRCTIAFIVCVLLFHKCTFRINRDLIVRAAVIGASGQIVEDLPREQPHRQGRGHRHLQPRGGHHEGP